MFGKLSSLSLVAIAIAPLVSSLTLQVPENPTSGGSVTLRWTSAAGDPDTWSFFLINQVFHNSFGIANNVDPAPQELTLTLPIVPVGGGYTLQAVNIGNVSDVYATTPEFSIGATSSSSSSTSQSSSSGSGSASSTSTRSSSSSRSVSRLSTPSSASDTTSASASVSQVAPFSGAAESFRLGSNIASITTALLSVAAGAALLVL